MHKRKSHTNYILVQQNYVQFFMKGLEILQLQALPWTLSQLYLVGATMFIP